MREDHRPKRSRAEMLEPSRRFSRDRSAAIGLKVRLPGEARAPCRRDAQVEWRYVVKGAAACGRRRIPDGRAAIPPRSQDRGGLMLPAATCGSSASSFLFRPSSALPSRTAGVLRARRLPRDSASGIRYLEASMLFTIALALLVVWGLGIAGVYAVGQIVHVLLLIGLMLLLLSFAKAHETATRRQGPGTGK